MEEKLNFKIKELIDGYFKNFNKVFENVKKALLEIQNKTLEDSKKLEKANNLDLDENQKNNIIRAILKENYIYIINLINYVKNQERVFYGLIDDISELLEKEPKFKPIYNVQLSLIGGVSETLTKGFNELEKLNNIDNIERITKILKLINELERGIKLGENLNQMQG